MNNKIMIFFLCILLVVVIIIGGILISGLNNSINRFKEQVNNTSAYWSDKFPGLEPDPANVEPDN